MLDDAESERLAQVSRLVAGYREAARRALDFARRYRDDEGAPGGARERACIAQAMAWRKAAHDVRAGLPVSMIPRPGLARARGDSATEETKRATG
jgi:hypothetical protein